MNDTTSFNNNISVFKGNETTLVLRGDYTITGVAVYKRDITQITYTEITVYDPTNDIKSYDIVYLFDSLRRYVGIVSSFKVENNTGIKTLSLAFDIDMLNITLPAVSSTYHFSPGQSFSRQSPIQININFTEVVTTSDTIISLDTALRQAFRKQHLKVEFTFTNIVTLTISPVVSSQIYNLHEADVSILDKAVYFADDSYNYLHLFNQDDVTMSEEYYLLANGTVTTNSALAQLPIKENGATTEVDNWNNIDYATSELKKQEYNNEINFTTIRTDLIFLKEEPLGRVINFYLENGTFVKTIISKIEVESSNIIYTLGLSRGKYKEQVNKDK